MHRLQGDPQLSKNVPNWAQAPWLEQHDSAKVLEATQGHRIITTHLPYNLLSSALQGSKAKDLQGSMERISSFLQCPLVGEELTNALRHFSFSSTSDNAMVNYTQIPKEIIDHSKSKFMRKGKIGDWRNTFSEEQIGIFDTVYSYQMKDCPLTFMWECPPESCGGGGGGQASGDQDRALILHDAGD
ncbi:sulfotransferase 2B1-like [Oncorhynchus tshawytscha]|uniref:sulfotransferase 2B1-like n=1 Tax=Oncorhynchus tshawytscha TaxID=74940 RepID=UPI001C3DE289|nr:sulfotransferase 2B1-like [Oncorhynchus tshawytscha]